MKEKILYGIIMTITLVNLLISAYMAYASFEMMWKQCKCATSGIYWYSILAYLIFSFVFVVYSFLSSTGRIHPDHYRQVLIIYIVSTIIFVFASLAYLKSVDISKCDCMSGRYRSFLSFMILLRYLGVIAAVVALMAYGIYIYFTNK